MSKCLIVPTIELLKRKGITFTAEMNGGVDEAFDELKSMKPDPHYVEHLLKPVLIINIGDLPYTAVIDAIDDSICFSCGAKSLYNLVNYFDRMSISYKIV